MDEDTRTTPQPAAPFDLGLAQAMWQAYADARPEVVAAHPEWVVDRFADTAGYATEIVGWIASRHKRATSDLVDSFVQRGVPLPRVGAHWVVCDGAGTPRYVLRTLALRLGTIWSADDDFAAAEGDGTAAQWRRVHREYWSRVCAERGERFTDATPIVLERFAVVWPPEAADAATSPTSPTSPAGAAGAAGPLG